MFQDYMNVSFFKNLSINSEKIVLVANGSLVWISIWLIWVCLLCMKYEKLKEWGAQEFPHDCMVWKENLVVNSYAGWVQLATQLQGPCRGMYKLPR